ncbi:hypothetical protein CLOLEP_02231 [[Clostridium] leptum DSM 753]|uniref:Uncharacterized protein n=1 Tax=[Clostridium] leptum DSM 753 TaxID=428125 RepID=A7VUI4_9FIRM|nr:hypothetical protein CLOLEP_02231 [[Clostridium] leptum DSM 753]
MNHIFKVSEGTKAGDRILGSQIVGIGAAFWIDLHDTKAVTIQLPLESRHIPVGQIVKAQMRFRAVEFQFFGANAFQRSQGIIQGIIGIEKVGMKKLPSFQVLKLYRLIVPHKIPPVLSYGIGSISF